MNDIPPIYPVNGRVLVEELPFRPSKIIQVISGDRADSTEAVVLRTSPKKYGRRKIKRGAWEHNGELLDHDVKPGDRIIMRPKYVDDDLITLNQKKYRILDPWEIEAIIEAPQPTFEDPITGEKLPDQHPIHIFGA